MNNFTYIILPQETPVVGRALIACLGLYMEEERLSPVESIDDADLIIVIQDKRIIGDIHLQHKYSDKVLVFFEAKGRHDLSSRIVYTNINNPSVSSILAMEEASKRLLALTETQEEGPDISLPDDLIVLEERCRILVIDDDKTNLDLAKALLQKHDVVTALGFSAGMTEIEQGGFDAVLTDLEMPENAHYQAFSNGNPETTREYGWLVMVEATLHGMPVAIVTDANHHRNWASAAFDRFQNKPMDMNGQPVRWFNNIGKRWDKALAALLDPK